MLILHGNVLDAQAQLVKARAPISTLVAIDELAAIATRYNSRAPKHEVEDVLDGLVWTGNITLENPPRFMIGKQITGEAAAKKAKQAPLVDVFGQGEDDSWWPSSPLWLAQDAEESFSASALPPWLAPSTPGLMSSEAFTSQVLEDEATTRLWLTDSFNLSFDDGSGAIACQHGARLWFTGSFGH